MSNLAIFKNPGAVAASSLPPSKLGQQIAEIRKALHLLIAAGAAEQVPGLLQ